MNSTAMYTLSRDVVYLFLHGQQLRGSGPASSQTILQKKLVCEVEPCIALACKSSPSAGYRKLRFPLWVAAQKLRATLSSGSRAG